MAEQFYQYSDPDRITGAVDALSAMTEHDRPFTRLVFSDEYKAARAWLQLQFEEIGLECRTDAGGNLIGTRKATSIGEPPRKVIIGSHIDTVAAGGRFDGIAGVIAGLETVHYLNQHNINLPFDIEIIDFLGEELNVWGTSCLGSRHMAGLLNDDLLARKDQALLVRRDALLVLDLGLDVLNRVRGLDLEGHGLAGESLHEDLHICRS